TRCRCASACRSGAPSASPGTASPCSWATTPTWRGRPTRGTTTRGWAASRPEPHGPTKKTKAPGLMAPALASGPAVGSACLADDAHGALRQVLQGGDAQRPLGAGPRRGGERVHGPAGGLAGGHVRHAVLQGPP